MKTDWLEVARGPWLASVGCAVAALSQGDGGLIAGWSLLVVGLLFTWADR